ncbi:alpha/beta hydrolase [Herminiimonas sp. KBW02]|uniref:alpha/beta hydrolase n=1 Tax=Herminiimonas sp. KBW02 TaxID=2153363 RepID=UPI000F58F4F9|nr:alpha/beta hydrolase [Herminiimonas sp. KBW02]RQO33994.1 alpha/beta hydrolase [Herminiimonas sp. KBW02]
MKHLMKTSLGLILACSLQLAQAQTAPKVVDLTSRPGVIQRMLVLSPAQPKAAVILLAGGHGGLQISPDGKINWGKDNFLVRARQLFVDQGFLVVLTDAPSDRLSPPFLREFRETPEHVTDIKAAITWVRSQTKTPVWLAGTSRGTQSAAYIATQLAPPDGPDGIALSSSILIDSEGASVLSMPLEKLQIPVLIVHHEQDGCRLCPYTLIPKLMNKLTDAPRKQLLSFTGGENIGNACNAAAHHGYNGLDNEVVGKMSDWMLNK